MTACKYTAEQAEAIAHSSGFEPLDPFQSANASWRCRCLDPDCRRESTPALVRMVAGRRCRFCSAKKRGEVRRSRHEATARAAMIEAGIEPIGEYPGASHPWPGICKKCRGEVQPWVSALLSGGQKGCKYCSVAERARKSRLPEEVAIEIALSKNMQPLEPYVGRHTPWRCRCLVCGKESSPAFGNICVNEACRFCSKKGPLDPEDAVARMIAAGAQPLEPFKDVHTQWKCRCLLESCGRIVYPKLGNIARHRACTHGDGSTLVGRDDITVYLITHNDKNAVKVGIKLDDSSRVLEFQAGGWCVVQMWGGNAYRAARVAELTVIDHWRVVQGLPYGVERDTLRRAGYTETAPLDQVDLDHTIALIELMLQ